MRRGYVIAVLAAVLLVLVAAVVVHGRTAVVVPGEPLKVPTPTLRPVAQGCCLWQIHKKGVGQRRAQFENPYRCDTGETAQGRTQIRLVLSSEGPPCDQNPGLVPDRSVLVANGRTIRRADGFAHFRGRFTIEDPSGNEIFNGSMEAIDRIGTHHPPFGSEACNQQGHLEGWIGGRGVGALESFSLHALIVARASLGAAGASAPINASIDGALEKCP